MDPITIITLANGAITMLETLVPVVEEAVKKGEISTDQQATLMARVGALSDSKGTAFRGPEWQKSTSPAPAPETPPTSIV